MILSIVVVSSGSSFFGATRLLVCIEIEGSLLT